MKIVADYMTGDVKTIEGDSSVLDSVALMKESQVGSVLITESGKPVGIFTERDLLTKVDFANPQKLL